MNIELSKLTAWSAPKRVETRNGPRNLCTGPATEAFWQAWRADKAALQKAGISCGKDRDTGAWQACWWQPIDSQEAEQRNATAAASRATDADITVPAPEGLDYRPFQRAGIQFALQRNGTLIGDEMGLGKTIQAIGVINADPSIKKVVVVTRASLKGNWANEMRRWLVRPMRVEVQHASDPWVGNLADVVICNFDIAKKFKEQLHAIEWDAAIVDEIQQAKNRKAQRTEIVLGAPKRQKKVDGVKVMLPVEPGIRARRRMALTGTPIEQRPEEAYTTLRWLDPIAWPSFWSYAGRYCGASYDGHGYSTQGASNLDELCSKLRQTLMVRRMKKDVLTELPPKSRMIVELEPDAKIAAAIAAEEAVTHKFEGDAVAACVEAEIAKLEDDDSKFRDAVEKLSVGRKLLFTEIARVRHDTAVAKLDRVLEALRDDFDAVGPKFLVFAHHKDVLQPLHAAFPGSVLITGETPAEERQGIVDKFQKDPECGPFFGSIRATGEGLTLTAASLVVFVEEDWVPGKISQCEDRAHRIGQRGNVLVKHYVVNNSIDAKMAQTHVAKQKVIDQALDGNVAEISTTPVMPIVSLKGSVLAEEPAATKPAAPAAPVVPVTDALRQLVHAGLKTIAGMDADHALQVNGIGFSKVDGEFGHALAERSYLTDKMVPYAVKLCRKYRKQLGEGFIAQLDELTK